MVQESDPSALEAASSKNTLVEPEFATPTATGPAPISPSISDPLQAPRMGTRIEYQREDDTPTLAKAIDLVAKVIGELKQVLDDIEMALEYLEEAERQKVGDERQLKQLQRQLEALHRQAGGRGHHRRPEHPQSQAPKREEEEDHGGNEPF